MLFQLLTYIASDGDLPYSNSSKSEVSSPYASPRRQSEQQLVPVEPQEISDLSKSQHEHVNNLLGEAMEESEVFQG